MKKIINFFILLFISIPFSYSQITIGGGPSLQKTFGVQAPYYGAHIMIEKATDEYQSFFGRFNFYGNQYSRSSLVNVEAVDPSVTPSVLQVNARYSFNYIGFDGGKRFYFGNGFNYGFAPYGGALISGYFNSIKIDADYDKSKYLLANGSGSKGSIFTIAFGLNGGLKYDFQWGTLYFDAALFYSIIAIPSNELARSGFYELGGPLLFNFGIGYKKTLW